MSGDFSNIMSVRPVHNPVLSLKVLTLSGSRTIQSDIEGPKIAKGNNASTTNANRLNIGRLGRRRITKTITAPMDTYAVRVRENMRTTTESVNRMRNHIVGNLRRLLHSNINKNTEISPAGAIRSPRKREPAHSTSGAIIADTATAITKSALPTNNLCRHASIPYRCTKRRLKRSITSIW